jgi:hypothetical protein
MEFSQAFVWERMFSRLEHQTSNFHLFFEWSREEGENPPPEFVFNFRILLQNGLKRTIITGRNEEETNQNKKGHQHTSREKQEGHSEKTQRQFPDNESHQHEANLS